MLLRTDDISGLWPMLISDSSPTAILQISLVIFPALQDVQMQNKCPSEDSLPGMQCPDPFFPGVTNRVLTFTTL